MTLAFSSEVVLVTGGSSGLGRAIALAFARHGATVAINHRDSEDAATEVAESGRRLGGRTATFRADVGDWDAAHGLVEQVAAALGPVTILVNNAAVTRAVPAQAVDQLTHGDWRRTVDVNVIGAFACVQAAIPGMVARGAGRVINVASDSAFTSTGSSIPYVVSKAAVVSLTRALALALAPAIGVDAIAPGWMATPWLDRNLPDDAKSMVRQGALIEPDAVASVVVDLARDRTATGRVIELAQRDGRLHGREINGDGGCAPWRPKHE